MTDLVWWVSFAGNVVSLLLMMGALVAAIYTTWREAPKFVARLTGVSSIESKVDQLLEDHRKAQNLMLQQAQEFNDLARVVGEMHDVPRRERPFVNPDKIREELMDDDRTNFTRADLSDNQIEEWRGY